MEPLDEEAIERRWGFLNRWWSIIKIHLSLEHPPHDGERWESPGKRLEVRFPSLLEDGGDTVSITGFDAEHHQSSLQWLREALGLLAIVEHFDYAAWVHILEWHCGFYLGIEGEALWDTEVPVHFLLKLSTCDEGYQPPDADAFDDDLVLFCGTHQRQENSVPYLQALKDIAALVGHDKSGVDIQVPVRVLLSSPEVWRRPAAGLMQVLSAEKQIKHQWETHGQTSPIELEGVHLPRCTFVLEPMVVDFALDPITSETASAIKAMVQENMWLSQISLKVEMGDDSEEEFDDFVEDDEDGEGTQLPRKEGFGRMMSSVFDSTRRDRPPLHLELHHEGDPASNVQSYARQLDAIHLTCDSSLGAREFEAMCSAIVVNHFNQTARKLSLGLLLNRIGDGDMAAVSAHWWKWIAYACFSRRARDYSSLESLALLSLSSLTVADMESFAAVLQSDHQEEELFGCPRGLVPERDATLQEDADIRWHFNSQGEPVLTSACLTVDGSATLVRTFSDDGVSEWVNALIPGYGRCQARRKDLVFRDSMPSSTGITSLTIGFDKAQGGIAHGLPLLLKAIGPQLKSLTLTGPRTPIDKDAILRYCPKLEDLVLSEYYVDVRLNFQEYRFVKNPSFDLHFDWNNITTLATQLSDAQNPLVKCVRLLRVHLKNRANELDNTLSNYDHVTLLERQLAALLKMLKLNKSLEYFAVVVPPDYEGYSDDFDEQHGDPISRTRKPLPTVAKLAFLSGLMLGKPPLEPKTKRGPGSATSCSLLSRMDPHVITEIFAFAAKPVYRAVYFRSEWDW